MAMWVVLQTLSSGKQLLTGDNYQKTLFQVSRHCPKGIWQIEKHLFKKTWYVGKKSENLWHLIHDLLLLCPPAWHDGSSTMGRWSQKHRLPLLYLLVHDCDIIPREIGHQPSLPPTLGFLLQKLHSRQEKLRDLESLLPFSPHSEGSLLCSRMRILGPIIPACSRGQSFMPEEGHQEDQS